jgi:glyoxylase-like metal-dependent hydrolase (beta-lactamase superfamily II)
VKELAPGLHLLSGFPPNAFNVYLVETEAGPVVVDTATRHARRRILRQLDGRQPAGILVTHAHRDHSRTAS